MKLLILLAIGMSSFSISSVAKALSPDGEHSGKAVIIAETKSGYGATAVNDTHIYWTDASALRRSKKDGTEIETLYEANGCEFPPDLSVTDTHAYVFCRTGIATSFALIEVPLDGASAKTLRTCRGCAMQQLSVDSEAVYWAEGNGGGATIYKIPFSTSKVSAVGTLPFHNAMGLAVQGDYVYWASHHKVNGYYANGGVGRAEKHGLANTYIAANEFGAGFTVLTATHVYWHRAKDGAIIRAPLTGGSAEKVAQFTGLSFLVADDKFLYVGEYSTEKISRISLDSFEISTLYSGPYAKRVLSLVVDQKFLLWRAKGGSLGGQQLVKIDLH